MKFSNTSSSTLEFPIC